MGIVSVVLKKPGNRRMADGDALGSSKRIAEIEERNVRVLHRRCAEDATMRGPFAGPRRPTHRRDRGCAVAPNLPPPSPGHSFNDRSCKTVSHLLWRRCWHNATLTFKVNRRSGFNGSLPTQTLPRNALAIHIRSGDVFVRRPNPFYVQPPLSFYQLVIDDLLTSQHRVDRVCIVEKDRKNSCVDALIGNLKIKKIKPRIQNVTFEKDLRTLVNAKHLVFGIGIFGQAVTWLSKKFILSPIFLLIRKTYATLIFCM